jgi:hypothetical protein
MFPPVPLKGRLRFNLVDNIVVDAVCDATEADSTSTAGYIPFNLCF